MKHRDKPRVKKHVCSLCFKSGPTEIHHIYSGSYRTKSDINDFVMELCHSCHMKVHQDPALNRLLKETTQARFEEKYPRSEFIKRMGKSWL